MDVSVITVTWNSQALIGEQIRSVEAACGNISCEQIIVDNASSDETVPFIKKEFPHVILIANTNNAGFGAANNAGYAKSSGRYLLLLNPDMRLEKGSLEKMVAWMDKHPEVGLASPKLLDEQGKVNKEALPRRFPRVWEQVALILKLPHIFPNLLNKYHMSDMDVDAEQEVDSVRGSFMLLRREIAEELGWVFDPRYFIWFEDVDTCREVQRLGYKVIYTPIISAVDYVGQSFKQRTSLWKQKQFTRSMLTYFQKWEPLRKWMWIALARPIGIGIVWLRNLIK